MVEKSVSKSVSKLLYFWGFLAKNERTAVASTLISLSEIFRLLAVHLSRAARHHDANMKRQKSRTNHARCERVNEKIVSDLNACAFGWNYRAVIGFKIGHCRQNRFFFSLSECFCAVHPICLSKSRQRRRDANKGIRKTRAKRSNENTFS